MLKVHVKKIGNIAILYLQGQITNGHSEVLRHSVQSASEVNKILLDFTRVTTVDGHGLGVMLELREQSEVKGIQFELMNVSKNLLRVFEITRLNTVFQIVSNIRYVPSAARNSQAGMQALRSYA